MSQFCLYWSKGTVLRLAIRSDFFAAHNAYNEAVVFCAKEARRGNAGVKMWLDNCSSLDDVLNVLTEARKKYETKGQTSSRRKSVVDAAGSVWKSLSARIVYYKDVLDVIAQHHPEYVSLAWGAMKFLFVVGGAFLPTSP